MSNQPKRAYPARGDANGLATVAAFISTISLVAAAIGISVGFWAVHQSRSTKSVTTAAPASSAVTLKEFTVSPKPVSVRSGGTLTVTNGGAMVHNLAIDGQALKTPDISPGQSTLLDVASLAVGTYTIYCTIAGHRQAGMATTLEIGSTGTGAIAAATPALGAMGPTHVGTDAGGTTVDQMDAMMLKTTKEFPAKTDGVGAQLLAPIRTEADGTLVFDLTAKIVKWEIEPGKFVDAWTYNGVVPGPTIKVRNGQKVSVVLHNDLPESTSIHFHGIKTPNDMDGVPGITQDPVRPGESFTSTFVAQGPAVGMYHSHENAVVQVPNGLAGALIIGDEPVPPGVKVSQEIPMMLNDSGTIGLSINGKSFPATAPVVAKLGDYVVVHYLNEGQMIHPMHLHGMGQTVIAKDGFPLAQPYEADTVTVAPGERYTVLIHADTPGTWAWHCHILSHAEGSNGMFGMVTALVVT